MPRKNSNLALADSLFAISKLLNQATEWINSLSGKSPAAIHNRQMLAINDQRLENMRLDAQNKHHRAHKLSNEVTITDARAELEYRERLAKIEERELKILERRLKLEAQGAFTPKFNAEDYPEPGDVRRGKPPK